MTAPSTFIATDRPGVVLVESSSHAGTFYVVTGFGTSLLVCSCPSASWRGGDCKHTRAALAACETPAEYPDTKGIHHGHGAFLCFVGYGHLCGAEDEVTTCECGHEAHTGRCTWAERVPDYRPGGNPWWWKRCACVKEGAA